MVQRNV